MGLSRNYDSGRLVLVEDLCAKGRRTVSSKAEYSLSLPCIQVQRQTTRFEEVMDQSKDLLGERYKFRWRCSSERDCNVIDPRNRWRKDTEAVTSIGV